MDPSPAPRETLVDSLTQPGSSALRRYQELHVGSGSLLGLVRYELTTLLLAPLPGALGLALRRVFYRSLFGAIGPGAAIGPSVTLRCPRRIHLGRSVFVDGGAVLDAKGEGSEIRLGDGVLVGRHTIVSCASSRITVGDDVSIGPFCYVRAGLGPVAVGSAVTIGSHVAVVSGSPGFARLDLPIKRQVGSGRGVEIADDVWVGAGAILIDGVRVDRGCVIGAGAVVTGEVPAYAIAAGVPARVIGSRQE